MALITLKANGMSPLPTTGVPGVPVPLSSVPLMAAGFSVQYHVGNTNPVILKDSAGNPMMILSENAPAANFMADDVESDEDIINWDLNDIFIDSIVAGQQVYLCYYTRGYIKY